MPTFIALLRGINVGGHKKVAMSDLRTLLTKLGFSNVRSLLQSGNLVFDADAGDSELERMLERETARRLHLEADFFVRSADEWRQIIARNPFHEPAKKDPGRLVVLCLRSAPAASEVKALQAAIKGREVLRVQGREAYIV